MKYHQEYKWFLYAYFALYFAFASLSVYMIPFLKEVGYDAWQRGVIFSVMALTSIVLQWVAGYFCDKFHATKKTFLVLLVGMMIATFLCYRYTEQRFWMHVCLISAMGGLYKLNYNLLDSWTLLCSEYTARKFGTMRAAGAIGFALGTYITSKIMMPPNYGNTPYVVLIASLMGMIACLRIPEVRKEKGWSQIKKEDFQALFSAKDYRVLILIFFFINIVGTADQYTTVDKLMVLEATKSQIGWKWAIQSLSEVPVFLGSVWLLRKIGGYRMMLVGTVCYVIKFACYGLASSVNGILWVTTMQVITYPLITLSSRILFALVAKNHPNLKTSTQLIASSITLGGSALLTPILCGAMVSLVGHDITLWVLAALLVPVLMYAIRNRKFIQTMQE